MPLELNPKAIKGNGKIALYKIWGNNHHHHLICRQRNVCIHRDVHGVHAFKLIFLGYDIKEYK